MSSKLPNDPASFTDAFNSNVDYTRAKGRATTGMGRTHQTQGVNLAQTQSDAQADEVGMSTTTDTSGAGVFGGDEGVGEPQVSIDSTNAGVDHRRTSYSLTGDELAHPTDEDMPWGQQAQQGQQGSSGFYSL